ncbi:hypothetical protein EZ449_14390 [Pedobacter frigidisoli]|uniref:Acyltransferase family protein n=1 Tax=Pedobacter frigidisoli TaxID=2530455 RepID=A0A4R0P2R5_9SPHI|nr:hypothetical protein [Pedobacter frigidisoli]TCD07718.1 hypothetical protein EZ449_14390 [Pedobacter frigidisoli]
MDAFDDHCSRFITADSLSTVINFLPLFALGISYFSYRKKLVNGFYFFGFALVYLLMTWINTGYLQTLSALITITILIIELPRNKLIAFFAKISFSLYLIHDIVGSRIVVLIGTLMPKNIYYKGVAFTTGLAISIGFAFAYYLFIERPFLNMAKKISYKGVE